MENLIVDNNASHRLNYESPRAAGAATSSAVLLHFHNFKKVPPLLFDYDDGDAQTLPLSVDILLGLRDYQDHQEHFASPLNLRIKV